MNDEDYICIVCSKRIGLNPYWMNSNNMLDRMHIECVDQLLEEFINSYWKHPERQSIEIMQSAREVMRR